MAEISANTSICLVTPGHITSNPRLIKEAKALTTAGFKVHIIFTQYVNYLVAHDKRILADNPTWTHDCLDWTTASLSSKKSRLISGIKQKISGSLAVKINRNYNWQLKKALACQARLYIAHNLGALPIVVNVAKKNKAKCGFDAEDFHRQETSDSLTEQDVILKIAIEDIYIPQTDYLTAASPLIADRYTTLYQKPVITVLNAFPWVKMSLTKKSLNGALQLFWFSQTIGPNRGLEDVIKAAAISKVNIDLHLLGNVDDDYKICLLQIAEGILPQKLRIKFHIPVLPDKIFEIGAQYDIGLAAEPNAPLNRDICLTNKIFTYLQCGLAIAATATLAQQQFMQQYSQTGQVYNNINELADIFTTYQNNRDLLHQAQAASHQLGQTTLNWENESVKFINTVNTCLN